MQSQEEFFNIETNVRNKLRVYLDAQAGLQDEENSPEKLDAYIIARNEYQQAQNELTLWLEKHRNNP